MIENLRKYKDPRNEGLDKHTRVAGGENGIAQVAELWAHHGQLFEMIATVALHDYVTNNEFDHIQLEAYKKGLAETSTFFIECAKIAEVKKEAKE